jgi:AraC family transcriptional regulator of adaptative response/methylated-DNA-[protein]-cysteine methyltransferase
MKGKRMKIGYSVVKSSLGRLLVAATPRGICSVMLGDSESDLTRELRQDFPGAWLEKEDERLSVQARALLACLEGEPLHPNLALDARGTAFQMCVWEELRRIPRGQRISYGELARRIGRPKAARAVARACATNPLAILIPCHRVVRENGDLAGYRWGIERKRRLLEQEQD